MKLAALRCPCGNMLAHFFIVPTQVTVCPQERRVETERSTERDTLLYSF